jgi:hypothetical protein
MSKHCLKALTLMSLALMAAILAPQRALADDDDPPSRVARLGFTSGAVSFQPAGTDDWVAAFINRPITTGDKLWTDQDSRAELNIGSASIRMSGMTGFSFLNLTDNVTQIQLTAGTLRVRVKRLDENETFEIDTPNLAFSVLRPGVYRINVDEGGDATIIKVRGGEGEITGGGSAFNLHPGEVGTFNGTDQLTADIEESGDEDGFDAWCAGRDRHEDLSVSARYVSPDVIGYQDLDQYGGWRAVPGYGEVWFPQTTIEGWAPYRYGHWAYVSPWGYTWIDDAPWGFAPFHYGRWINYGGVWGWVPCPPPAPGVVYVRPVYAPALVAWVGGPHFAVGVSAGGGFGAGVSVGWFPLGPREVYVPSYPVSRTYVTNVNVSNTVVNTTVVNNYYNTTVVNRNTTVVNNNVTVIHQTYVNQNVAGAVTATTPQAFTSAQPVARNVVRVDAREVAAAPVNAFTPAVAPAKQAVLGSGTAASVRPPAVVQTRAVVAKVAPPPPPVSFARQQQAIQANGGRPLAAAQVRQIQPQTVQAAHPMVKVAPPSTPSVPQNVQGNRPGQPQNAGGNTGNRGDNRNSPGTTHTGPQPPVSNNQPGASTNNSQPVTNTNRPNTPTNTGQPGNGNASGGGNANPDRRTFNDRPASASGGNNSGPGNGPAPGNTGNNKNVGNNNPDRRTFNDRPASTSGGNNSGPGNGPADGNTGNNKNVGNNNPDRRTFNDRPANASGGNNSGPGNGPAGGNTGNSKNVGNNNPDRRTFNDRPASTSGGNNAGPGNNPAGGDTSGNKNVGNANPDRRTFNDHPPSASGGNNSGPGNGPASNQRHEQQPQNGEQKHDNQAQKPQQKQQQEKKDTSSKSKDDQHH